jgi:hypothetical protein
MLAYAATPVCLVLALLSGGPQSVCTSMSAGSQLGGMATMYLVMALLHAGPWLRLLSKRLIMKDL